MDPSEPQFEQIKGLLAALCDGEITREEAARLEQAVGQSPTARQYFVRYMQMHGEICWAAGHGVGHDVSSPAAPEAEPVRVVVPATAIPARRSIAAGKRRRRSRSWLLATTAASLLAVASGVFVFLEGGGPNVPDGRPPQVVAHVERTSFARWPADAEALPRGAKLLSGQSIVLDRGLALIRFRSGAEVVLEGPADLRLETGNRGHLRSGSLVARVPSRAAGFAVRTPSAMIVDRGTELGVAIERNGGSDVRVFEGKVEVQAIDSERIGALPIMLTAGRAVRIRLGSGGTPEVVDLNPATTQFARALPPAGPSARLRALVSAHPQLIHYYTFEGTTFRSKCLDRSGGLPLQKVAMSGGDGSGDLYELAPGIDSESNAVRPYRSPERGNTTGVALRSKGAIEPHPALTVELLLKLQKTDGWSNDAACTAFTLRGAAGGSQHALAATNGGRLAYRPAGGAPWLSTDLALRPGDWYYLAATFRSQGGDTRVDCYAANVSKGQALESVMRGQRVPWAPCDGQLGIGTGFDSHGGPVCPWQGILDEVAVYAGALSEEDLQAHLDALVGPP